MNKSKAKRERANETTIKCSFCKGTFKYVESSGGAKLWCEVKDWFVPANSAHGIWLMEQGEVIGLEGK